MGSMISEPVDERVWRVDVQTLGLERFATLQPSPGQSDAFWNLDWPREAFNLAVIERAGRIVYSIAEVDAPLIVSREHLLQAGVPAAVLEAMVSAHGVNSRGQS